MKQALAAILYADVVEYSKLTEIDERATYALLRNSLNLFTSITEANDGIKIKEAGDAILCKFSSVSAAVDAAIEFQKKVSGKSIITDSEYDFKFRIGINIGEIIHDRDDIFGDGVNIAARIQSLAVPGAISISAAAYDQVKGKLEMPFHDTGFHKLKNISQPVQVYNLDVVELSGSVHPAAFFSSRVKDQPLFDLDSGTPKKGPIAKGGCLCGSIRYEITEPEIGTGFCHCSICQRALGAPINAWVAFPKTGVSFLGEEPRYYRSSEIAERGFCPVCGTSLTYRLLKPKTSDYLVLCTAALNNPQDYAPVWHGGIESKLPWLNVHDDLPRMRTEESPSLQKAWHSVGIDDPAKWKPNPSESD